MDDIHELLTRGVDTIYPSRESLETTLRTGKKLKLYQGFDPTGTELHIGHMIGLRKLSQWQKLGHKVIFLIGTGTGQAGDPSGKLTSREKFFNEDELKQNAKDYVMQAKKLLNFEGENPVEILYNGDWLNTLKLADILNIAEHLTLQQLIERDMFQKRLEQKTDINMREFMYPLLQGYDSVAMDVDLELGGSDQTFNMLVGRKLQRSMNSREKFVMTTPLLADSQGNKIGKSEGNVISITDTPNLLFAKIMSLGDEIIIKGLEYLTDVPMDEINSIDEKLKQGENPIEFKKRLAYEVVKQLSTEAEALSAQEEFQRTVQNKEIPNVIPEYTFNNEGIIDVLVNSASVVSKSDAKRLLEQGGVEVDNVKLTHETAANSLKKGSIIKVGKHKFLKLI